MDHSDSPDAADSDWELAAAETAVELTPADPDAWLALASVHFAAKRYASATVAAREAVRLAPAMAEAHRRLAEASILTSAPDSYAIAAAREAVRLEPGESRHHATLGDVLLMAHRRGDAIRAFSEAARLDPHDASGVAERASRLQAQVAINSLLLAVQVIAWGLLASLAAQTISAALNGVGAPIALIGTPIVAAALAGLAVWRYRVMMRGCRMSLAGALRSDPVLAAAALCTGLPVLLLLISPFISGELTSTLFGASAAVLVLALILVGVRRVLV